MDIFTRQSKKKINRVLPVVPRTVVTKAKLTQRNQPKVYSSRSVNNFQALRQVKYLMGTLLMTAPAANLALSAERFHDELQPSLRTCERMVDGESIERSVTQGSTRIFLGVRISRRKSEQISSSPTNKTAML